MQIHTIQTLSFQRKSEILSKLKISKSTFHSRINDGEYPPLISVGERVVAYLAHETDEIISAIASGKSKNEMKELAVQLVERRSELKSAYISSPDIQGGK